MCRRMGVVGGAWIRQLSLQRSQQVTAYYVQELCVVLQADLAAQVVCFLPGCNGSADVSHLRPLALGAPKLGTRQLLVMGLLPR